MRRSHRASRLILLAQILLVVSCTHPARTTTLHVPVEMRRSSSGSAPLVRISVPADWRPMAPSLTRLELLGPDHRSRLYLRSASAQGASGGCSALARKSAEDVVTSWGKPPRTRVLRKAILEDQVELELRRLEPEPAGELMWYRIVCRNQALAVASCTVPAPREQAMKRICRDVLDSIDVVPRRETQSGK